MILAELDLLNFRKESLCFPVLNGCFPKMKDGEIMTCFKWNRHSLLP